jgi:membrane fusion protein, multidrug efflux system
VVAGGVVAVVAAYEILMSYVAYTDDSYVRTDLVAVAPMVTGRIVALQVHDNEPVKKRDLLFSIDPVPFRLAVAQKQAEIGETMAQIAADQQASDVAQDRYAAAVSAVGFARDTQKRLATLNASGYIPRQSLDRVNDTLKRAQDDMAAAEASIAQARSVAAMHQASLARARVEMATAQWELSRTEVVSPTDGIVNNLTIRVGDTAKMNEPLIGILDAHAWRIVANYKQYYLRNLKPGERVWVWLDSQPWHLHRAHIASIGQGISRDLEPTVIFP